MNTEELNSQLSQISRLNHIKEATELLKQYEQMNISLQYLINLNLEQMINVAKSCNLYAEINGEKVPLYKIGLAMKTYGCDFDTLYRNVFSEPLNVEKTSQAFRDMLNKISQHKW